MTYSLDFRAKVLAIRAQEDLTMIEVAKRFGVGVASVMRWSNSIEAKKTRQKPPTRIDMDLLKDDIKKHPDAYLKERAKRLNVSHNCVWMALKRLGVTYKKNSAAPKSGRRKTLYLLPKT